MLVVKSRSASCLEEQPDSHNATRRINMGEFKSISFFLLRITAGATISHAGSELVKIGAISDGLYILYSCGAITKISVLW